MTNNAQKIRQTFDGRTTIDSSLDGRTLKWYCAILLIIVIIVYANTLANDYAMDDVTVITENTYVKQGIKAIPDLLVKPRLYGYLHLPADSYRPVSLVMFAIEYQLFGPNPFWGHLFNVLSFAGCVIILFLFLHHLFRKQKSAVAFIAALIFAIHPIHTEVVANIKSRDELLACFFGFAALLSYLKYADGGTRFRLVAGIFFYLLACFSRESVITFIVVIPVLLYCYRKLHTARGISIAASAFTVAAVFLLVHRMVLSAHHVQMAGPDDFTTNALIAAPDLNTRLATAFLVLGKYICLLLVPYPLVCNYSFSAIPFVGWANVAPLLSLVFHFSIAILAVYWLLKRKRELLAFAILYYLITIALFSNIGFLITSQMAERFLFLPSIGFCIVAALGAERLGHFRATDNSSFFTTNKKILLVFVPVLMLFGFLTIARNQEWKDNETLFSADIIKAPNDCKLNFYKAVSIRTDINATVQQRLSVYKEQMGYLQTALDIYPDFQEAHTTMAKIYEDLGSYDSALAHNLIVLRINRENSIAAYHAAVEYFALKQYEQAIGWFRVTLAVSPQYKLAHVNLAKCFGAIGMPDSAIVYYRSTLSLDTSLVIARRGLALSFFEIHQLDSAADHMKRVVASDPENIDDLNNLGAIYLSAANYTEAIRHLSTVVRLAPDYAVGHGNLGNAFFYSGQYQQAINCFERQLQMDTVQRSNIPNLKTAYDKLGLKNKKWY